LLLARHVWRLLADFLDSLVKFDELGKKPLLVRVELCLPFAQISDAGGQFG